MSKFDTFLEKVIGSLLSEDNTGMPPTSSNILPDNTSYDFTVTLIKELISTGLMNAVDIKKLITGDNINKTFYFPWTYKDLSYSVKVFPDLEVLIINNKDKADIKRFELHTEDAVDEVIDYLNQKREEKENNETKPTQFSNEPSALPGGTATPEGSTATPASQTPNIDQYIKGLK
jgi:hypothetical protein